MLTLQTLQLSLLHGYGIVQTLRLGSGKDRQVETGAPGPALNRLERQGQVRSGWKQSASEQ